MPGFEEWKIGYTKDGKKLPLGRVDFYRRMAGITSKEIKPFSWDCEHRGPTLRVVDTPGCGCGNATTQVLECRKYGECTIQKVREKDGTTYRSCYACLVFQENK